MKKRNKIEAIDLFCGIGGLSCGLRQANIKVLAGLDFDASCKETYEKNNKAKFYGEDIATFDFSKLKKLYSKDSIKVLVGCAPCQPFSAHSNKRKDKEINDPRWNLVDHFMRGIRELDPDIISMENVRGLQKQPVFHRFVNELQKDYEVSHDVVYCPDYGVPQARYRLVLMATRKGLGKIEVPTATHSKDKYITVGQVLKELPKLTAGETYKKDIMHKSLNLQHINIRRIQQSKPKGTWKDWDYELLPECYKRPSGASYTAVYGRMSWNDVAPTITTQFFNYGSGRFGHPEQDRALSLREGAILQTFPVDYDFGDEVHITRVARQIGNAVPPRLGEVIGDSIINHINTHG